MICSDHEPGLTYARKQGRLCCLESASVEEGAGGRRHRENYPRKNEKDKKAKNSEKKPKGLDRKR